MANFIETEGRKIVARGWREGEMESGLMGIEFQLGKMKIFWRLAAQCENT